MKKLVCVALALFMVFGLAACSSSGETATGSPAAETSAVTETVTTAASTGPATMTDAGTPRAETLVQSMISGRWTGEMKFNPYITGTVYQGNGLRSNVNEYLWEADASTGKQSCVMAADFPKPLDDTYTKFEVKLKQGIKWSDGVDFTADDLVFTSDLLLNTPTLTYSGAWAGEIKSITKVDDYTVTIETVNEETRLEQFLGETRGDTSFKILPKHIFENVDASTYEYEEAIGTGPYILKSYDPNGNYFLYEKREDWQCSGCGMTYGEPAPKYILFEYFGDANTTDMAAINNKLDIYNGITMDSFNAITAKNPEFCSWNSEFPYGRVGQEPNGIMFNCAATPLDNANVRWALVLALKCTDLTMAAQAGATRVDPTPIPCMDSMSEEYIEPLVSWLQDLTLSDGYKPFNDSYAQDISEILTQQGIQGLPTDEESQKDMFGVGWWKNDTVEAENLLLTEGFTRGSDGMWLKPDGTPWKINLAYSNISLYERLAVPIVNAWKEFGIDAAAAALDGSSTFRTALSQGTADCYLTWTNSCGILDLTSIIRTYDSSFIAPIGEDTSSGYLTGACARFNSPELDAIIDELVGLTAEDPRVTELCTDYIKLMTEEMPYCVVYTASMLNATSTHYWTGFASEEQPYSHNMWWNANFPKVAANLTATGNQ